MKNIKFIPSTEKAKVAIDPPVPSKKTIPGWFKKIPLKIFQDMEVITPQGTTNLTAKSCPAVIDTITAGYTITLGADVIFVNPEEYGHRVIWDVSWPVVSSHLEEQITQELVPYGFEARPLKWERIEGWAIETPPGYSLLYFHPFYRNDLPFVTLPGIVDSDVYNTPTNLPFFIKKDFYGIVEKGTPIAQIIPIKRETWNHKIDNNVLKDYEYRPDIVKSVIYKSYKKRWWKKKTYK